MENNTYRQILETIDNYGQWLRNEYIRELSEKIINNLDLPRKTAKEEIGNYNYLPNYKIHKYLTDNSIELTDAEFEQLTKCIFDTAKKGIIDLNKDEISIIEQIKKPNFLDMLKEEFEQNKTPDFYEEIKKDLQKAFEEGEPLMIYKGKYDTYYFGVEHACNNQEEWDVNDKTTTPTKVVTQQDYAIIRARYVTLPDTEIRRNVPPNTDDDYDCMLLDKNYDALCKMIDNAEEKYGRSLMGLVDKPSIIDEMEAEQEILEEIKEKIKSDSKFVAISNSELE